MRTAEIVVEIRATPEEVFRAVTEAEWIQKWFAPEARVDPRVGGEFLVSWGPGMEIENTITAFDPYTHFGTGRDRSVAYGRGGKPIETGVMRHMATDYYIEAIGDGITRLRLVQSGFGEEAAWDEEIESTGSGWRSFLNKLKEVIEAR